MQVKERVEVPPPKQHVDREWEHDHDIDPTIASQSISEAEPIGKERNELLDVSIYEYMYIWSS